MGTGRPQAGDTVKLLGLGIAVQEALVEVVDAEQLLLRMTQIDGFAVGMPLELQYQHGGDLCAVRGRLSRRAGNMWWLSVETVDRVQRRQHVRIATAAKATLLLPNPSGGEDAFLVDLLDVSIGGCAFSSNRPFLEGGPVELRFRVLDGRVRLQAVTLQCRAEGGCYRVRCRFEGVTSADEQRLGEWVAAQNRSARSVV
jgi:PilZ domain-containing protein